jgi:tetratricopeptide (TPR) repeat protein
MRDEVGQQRLNIAVIGLFATVVVCMTIFAYTPALDAPFVLDDGRNIIDSPAIRWTEVSMENIALVLKSSLLGSRPVANMSFALDHVIWGLDPYGYHLTNILIHLAVGGALLWLCLLYIQLTTGGSRFTISGWKTAGIAIISVGLFLVHPLNTQAVTYVVQRMTSLSALFTVLAFASYLMARYRVTARSRWWYLAALLFWIIGIGSKEIGFMLLPVILLFEVCFFHSVWQQKIGEVLGGTWSRRWTIRAWLGAGIVFGLAGWLITVSTDLINFTADFPGRDFNGLERLMTQARVQIFHLSQLFWPSPARLNLDHDFAVSRGLLDPATTLLAILACFVLLAGAIRLAAHQPRYGFPLVAYALLHSIEAGPIGLEIIFEHRMYLPSAMLVLLLATLLVDSTARRRAIVLPICVVTMLVLAGWTHARNQVWAEPLGIDRDMAMKSPNKARAQYNFAFRLSDVGLRDEALPVIQRAIELDPADERHRGLLGEVLLDLGQAEEAVVAYQGALDLAPDDVRSVLGLGNALRAAGREDDAFQYCLDAGIRLARGGHPWEAIPILQAAAEIHGDDAGVRNALGNTYMGAGLSEKALEQFRAAIALEPTQYEAWFNLGVAADALGLRDEAILAYQGFLQRAPANLQQPIMRARTRIRALSSGVDQ